MQLKHLQHDFDMLQKKFGHCSLRAIYGAGCLTSPKACFVFMNPTGRNISADPAWRGLRAPWLGTKNVWKIFSRLGLLSPHTYGLIRKMKAEEWTKRFAGLVYKEISENGAYITNLAKATQTDSKPLPDFVFRNYLPLFLREMECIGPKIIISFGNQVSSVLLGKKIKVSDYKDKEKEILNYNNKDFAVYPVYYPVGQGMRNMGKAIKRIRCVINTIKR